MTEPSFYCKWEKIADEGDDKNPTYRSLSGGEADGSSIYAVALQYTCLAKQQQMNIPYFVLMIEFAFAMT